MSLSNAAASVRTSIDRARPGAAPLPVGIAALGVVLLAALIASQGLGLPPTLVATSDPTLTVTPNSAAARANVRVTGEGFPAGAAVQLDFDGSTLGMPSPHADSAGSFRTVLVVPQVKPGRHDVAARGPGAPPAGGAPGVPRPKRAGG